ncbi:hypothetical protein [Burkholderia glumae]|uniref:hypothetical protein n=1 Tax=Burkholderia glumae TaxID=337 RepID=UPI0021509CFD|nr:hypothetical protein [Burkholderia glumae]
MIDVKLLSDVELARLISSAMAEWAQRQGFEAQQTASAAAVAAAAAAAKRRSRRGGAERRGQAILSVHRATSAAE